jgi:multidrug efflux pump subunit AcrA (membrane-fusion protein)
VKQGDILAVMDDDILRASLEVARRSMNAEGLLKSAQADLDMKTQEQEKLKQLRERDHASQQEVDRIQTEIRIAEARLLSVKEDLEVKQLESRRIESQLKQRQVIAPMDGVISELSREAGEFVSPSDPTIARLVQLGERENGGECDEGNEGDAEPAQRLTGRQQHERPDEGGTLVLDIGQRHDRECTVPDGVCHTRGKAIGSIGRNRKPRQLLVTGKFRLHEP